VRALVVVAAVRGALWLRPFARVAAACATRRVHADTVTTTFRAETVARITVAVHRMARVVPRATCLCQALAAQWMLGGVGVASDVRFGVTRSAGSLDMHAWLEVDGRRVLGDSPTSHTPFERTTGHAP